VIWKAVSVVSFYSGSESRIHRPRHIYMPCTECLVAVASTDTVWNLSPFSSLFSPTHAHARTDTHRDLLISWPFLYSWYVVGEMIGQIRHLISCHTHVVCMCIQNAAISVMLFYSYAPTCTARLRWVFWAPGSGNHSGRSKRTRIQHSQKSFLIYSHLAKQFEF